MPIDGLLFTALAQQLHAALQNARIQAVSQPDQHHVYLDLRQPGETKRLLISIDAKHPSVHLSGRHFTSDEAPPPFCLLLRKHLIPGRVLSISQQPFERALHIDIEGRDESGQRAIRTLIVEMMGRQSNVILIMQPTQTIIDCMKRVPGGDLKRELLPHRKYESPASSDQINPTTLDFEAFDRFIRLEQHGQRIDRLLPQRVLGISPFAAREMLIRAGCPVSATTEQLDHDQRRALYEALMSLATKAVNGPIQPTVVLNEDRHQFWLFDIRTETGQSVSFDDLSAMLDFVHIREYEKAQMDGKRQRLKAVVERHIKRVAKKAQLQQAAVDEAEDGTSFRVQADLLMANLHAIRSGVSSVTLDNWFDQGQPITIALDPAKSPAENANEYYRKYQKAKKTVTKAGEQLEASLAELDYLNSVQLAIRLSATLSELKEIEEELIAGGYATSTDSAHKKSKKKQDAASEPMQFVSSDGLKIWVGRNNRQNDMLTMHRAKPDDMWFHVRQMPGAHVIVQTGGLTPLPEQTLLEAAHLAAYYSSARSSSRVPVDYTLRKHVRKPKSARPGMVIYDNQRTVYVTPDASALAAMSRR